MSGQRNVTTGSIKPVHSLTDSEQTLKPVIEIQGLKKSYGLKPILRRLDLSIMEGRRVALLGANGAGKTTLLRILAGLSRPGAGTVTIAGLDLQRDAQQVRHAVGFIAHQPYLYEELTALENLLFFARLYHVDQARERADTLLQRIGLEKKRHERIRALSRGQVQRVAWARALLHSPSVLLLDEPDTGMDQAGNDLIVELLTEHSARGGSILFTTHNLDRALALSDQVAIIAGGRIAYEQMARKLTLEELQCVYREVAR